MFRHPIPLNTLCHHQANIAYDKLAVISDHIDELANVADCILDLKEYLFHILKLYVTLAKDETITGKKKFTKPITTTRVNLYNEVDETDNIAFIETGWDNCAPYVDLHVDREDSQSHEKYKANIRLLLDPCDDYKAKFLIPYTDGEEDYSAVCVKYLEEQLDIIRTRIAALEDRVSTAENDIDNLEDRATQVEGRVSQVETRIDNWPPDKDTTYSFALENGRLVIRANDGTTQAVDLSSMNASIAGDAFAVGSTIIIAIGFGTYLDYGVIISGGTVRGYCPDDDGGATTGYYNIPGTWICCTSNGNTRNVRGGIIRRIA